MCCLGRNWEDRVELSTFSQRRLSVYLAGLGHWSPGPQDVWEEQGTVLCGASESRRHIFSRYADRYSKREFRGARYKNYIREAQRLVSAVDRRATFEVFPGDTRDRFSRPTFVKSRMVRDRDAPCVLLPLDRGRHWNDIAQVASQDLDFKRKADTLVWRGGTTGVFKSCNGQIPYSGRFHVASLAIPRAGLDIAYSEIVQLEEEATDIPMSVLRSRVRPPLSMREQLQSKFLLSLEGNDVATGLKWMLYSNSAVVMPRPTCESWACEGELVPFKHYIPVKDDLSDIEEVFDWCLTHPDAAEEIAHNGRRYIENFLEEPLETEILRHVILSYLEKAPCALHFGPLERLVQRLTRP